MQSCDVLYVCVCERLFVTCQLRSCLQYYGCTYRCWRVQRSAWREGIYNYNARMQWRLQAALADYPNQTNRRFVCAMHFIRYTTCCSRLSWHRELHEQRLPIYLTLSYLLLPHSLTYPLVHSCTITTDNVVHTYYKRYKKNTRLDKVLTENIS